MLASTRVLHFLHISLKKHIYHADFGGLRPLTKPWQAVTTEEATFFTPVNYRPSLLRRIRDSWSLYSAAMCLLAFTLTTVVPFLAVSLAGVAGSAFSMSVIVCRPG